MIGIIVIVTTVGTAILAGYDTYMAKPEDRQVFSILTTKAAIYFTLTIIGFVAAVMKEIQSGKDTDRLAEGIKGIQEDNSKYRSENQTSGKLCAFYSEEKDEFTIHFGSNRFGNSKSFLEKEDGVDFFQRIYIPGVGCNPFRIGLDGHKIVISGEFRDHAGSFTALL